MRDQEIFRKDENLTSLSIENLEISVPNGKISTVVSSQIVEEASQQQQQQPSMEIACDLVQSLLDQVSWNDSPPTNEELGRKNKSLLKTNKPPEKQLTPQCHVPNTLPQIPKDPSSSSLNAASPANLWKLQYNSRYKIAEQKMGNVALATLCARTLETVGRPSLPSKEANGEETWIHNNNKIANNKTKPGRKRYSPKMQWIRRKKSDITSSKSSPVDKSQTFFNGNDESREDNNNISRSSVNERQDTEVKLQMFGSEYARYLSTTALAPKEIMSPRGHTISKTLPPRKSRSGEVEKIEEADPAVLTGAVTDIIITQGNEKPPKGFYRISQTANRHEFYLYDRKKPAYINIKKESNWDRAAQRPCVTALTLVYPERKEFVPPGFSVVSKYTNEKEKSNKAVSLNHDGEPVFLCFRRSREGNPITGIVPLVPNNGEHVPQGFTVLERTPRNYIATIQTSSSKVFLAYRQRLANLEPLRPIPLVMAVQNPSSTKSRRLHAYYCTGGTMVKSRVGHFHIMDRSTHSLLSPKSVSNRLSMIEASRKNELNSLSDLPSGSGNTYMYSHSNSESEQNPKELLTSSLLVAPGLDTPGSKSIVSDIEKLSLSESDKLLSSFGFSDNDVNSSRYSRNLSFHSHKSVGTEDQSFESSVSSSVLSIVSKDKELGRCLKALSFIPIVSTTVNESDPNEMLNFQTRVAVLTPVLTACYTRHGGSALLAVDGLTTLLHEGFFANDINVARDTSTRITLLDIVLQVVCDVATMGTQEIHMQACVEFVAAAVKYGCGHLNTRTTGYVMRFYLFVFSFGVSIPGGDWGLIKGRDIFFLEDPRTPTLTYLPGGAPQAATLSLRDFISFSIARLRSLTLSDKLSNEDAKRQNSIHHSNPAAFNSFIDKLIDETIDNSVHRVDIANYTQLAMHQIYRAGGSELFWYDMMNTCGTGLFHNDDIIRQETRHMYSICFSLLTTLVKEACSQVRRGKSGIGVPRDTANKLMSLEMINFFLKEWELGKDHLDIPNSRSFGTFAFCVRRLVVPCLLANTRDSLLDPRIFKRILRIIGTLWCSPLYRIHLKLELGILLDHFVLKILRLGPQILLKKSRGVPYLFAQQLEVMVQAKSWFSTKARVMMEMFLNFDTEYGSTAVDGKVELFTGIQWNICEQMCSCLCNISEKCGEFLESQILESQAMTTIDDENEVTNDILGMNGMMLARESAQRLQSAAILATTQIVQCLAQSAASSRGRIFKSVIDHWTLPETKFEMFGSALNSFSSSFEDDSQENESSRKPLSVGYWKKKQVNKKKGLELLTKAKSNVYLMHPKGQEEGSPTSSGYVRSFDENKNSVGDDYLSTFFEIATEKTVKKAVDYLIACDVLALSPRDIASFLRIHRAELKPSSLGSYLGEGGTSTAEIEHWNLIRFCFIRAISFVGMKIEKALRHLLTNGGFRLPGEAQKIDRIIVTFSQCYWEDNAGDRVHCPFQDQDTVYFLSFALIMLNTDLHKSDSTLTKKQPKKMSKAEFLQNLDGVLRSEGMNKKYLSSLYDSILARPIVMREEDFAKTLPIPSENLYNSLEGMMNNAQTNDALLRGVSNHVHRFISFEEFHQQEFEGDKKKAGSHLTRRLFAKTWHQFHGMINAALDVAYLDAKALENSVDLLKYLLSITICLDLKTEQSAFLGQLDRLRLFKRATSSGSHLGGYNSTNGNNWQRIVENASGDEAKLECLESVNKFVDNLRLNISADANDRKAMRDAVAQLENAEFLMNDPHRTFLRQDDLVKKANTTGRCTDYRFFLFSDMLIYAKKLPDSQKYKVHEELPLLLMKIVDWFPPETKDGKISIQVFHPRKKVTMLCADEAEKKSWVESLRSAISNELERKVAIEAGRVAASHNL